jgi:hypothetical protein
LSGDCIEPDTSIRNTRFVGSSDFEALDADLHEQRLRIPRRRRHFRGHAERHVAARRRRVSIVEVIDHLLDPHRILRRQLAAVEKAPHVGVRAGVDVDREGGDWLLGDQVHRVVILVLVTLGVRRLLVHGRRAAVIGHHRRRADRGNCRRYRLLSAARALGARHDDLLDRSVVRFRLGQAGVGFLGCGLLRLRSLLIGRYLGFITLGRTGGDDCSHDQQRAAAHDTIHGSFLVTGASRALLLTNEGKSKTG